MQYEWIKVEDKLPAQGEMVLVAIYGTDVIVRLNGETMEEAIERSLHGHGRVDLGFMDEDGYWCGGDGFPHVIEPTYWTPLPEPPKV